MIARIIRRASIVLGASVTEASALSAEPISRRAQPKKRRANNPMNRIRAIFRWLADAIELVLGLLFPL